VVIANSAIAEVQRGPLSRSVDVLEGRRLNSVNRYPDVSLAIVPIGESRGIAAAHVGPWTNSTPPTALPAWVGRSGFQGLVLLAPPPGQPIGLAVRAIATPGPQARWAMVVDLPVDQRLADQWQTATGIDLERVNVLRTDPAPATEEGGTVLQRAPSTTRFAFNTVTFFDYTDWDGGEAGTLFLSLRVAPAEMYRRFAAVQSRFGDRTMGDIFLVVLGILGVTFLVIEAVALVMGMALARSITSAIHELFEGTRRVKSGDFGHRIRVLARDQLGELAGAFNEMTSSIQDLLRQQEEKRRLEEELRIARDIQLSLLPRGTLGFPGLAISTVCVPAMEVGGDYFDFFRIDERRVGFLIADVAGKGTFAALYMAELKGLMLSLSRIHPSPKRLLVEVNRILSHTLDGRSFISMTYAVLDLGDGRLEYARAGHTPLIHVTGQHHSRVARVLAPSGIVVGLQHPGAEMAFERHLDEASLMLQPGDVLVLYTDGLTEAMNEALDLFGETRLLSLAQQPTHDGVDALRERILAAIADFRGTAIQHDDMTMIVMEVQDMSSRRQLSATDSMQMSGLPA